MASGIYILCGEISTSHVQNRVKLELHFEWSYPILNTWLDIEHISQGKTIWQTEWMLWHKRADVTKPVPEPILIYSLRRSVALRPGVSLILIVSSQPYLLVNIEFKYVDGIYAILQPPRPTNLPSGTEKPISALDGVGMFYS